jgi:superfamily II DNA helicase RecQ
MALPPGCTSGTPCSAGARSRVAHSASCTIACSRWRAEALAAAALCRAGGLRAAYYHAQRSERDKREIEEAWLHDELEVIVATHSSFGVPSPLPPRHPPRPSPRRRRHIAAPPAVALAGWLVLSEEQVGQAAREAGVASADVAGGHARFLAKRATPQRQAVAGCTTIAVDEAHLALPEPVGVQGFRPAYGALRAALDTACASLARPAETMALWRRRGRRRRRRRGRRR